MPGRVWRAVSGWAERLWSDLKASTDASLLGVLRFLGLLYGPIDTRKPIDEALRASLRRRLPAHVGWRHAIGGIAYLLFGVLVVTGVLLSFYYRPSTQEAYPSVQHIVSGVRLGWLVRDLHVWSANLVVVAALAHMAQVFFDGTYKPPRETNWLAGVLLLFIVFAFGATGYLLPWDQWAYWTVTEELELLARVPILGGLAVEVLRGDPVVSGATLSRFFAVHVIVLPWIALGLLSLHFAMVRRHGIAPPPGVASDGPAGEPFFPNHLLRSFSIGALVLAVTITAAVLFPREVGETANPAQPPDAMVSTWIMADVVRALTYYLGPWGLNLFLALGFALALLPIFDRGPDRGLRHRPLATALGMVFFLGGLAAWVAGRGLHDVPPPAAVRPAILPDAAVPAPTGPGRETPR
jgi:quinol-cytochrome oxidoreductase complex cytochrome b subunit